MTIPSMYKQYRTSSELERSGVWFDFGEYRIKLGRAGGANKGFARVIEAKSMPYRRAIQTGAMDPSVEQRILRESYVEAVILGWEVKDGDNWVPGIHDEDGSVMPFNHDNVEKVLVMLPELFMDLQGYANDLAAYREQLLENDAGN